MPTYFARKAGNINAADVWATTPTGTAAAVTLTNADTLVANNFIITINVDTTVAEVRNDPFSGATGGGYFAITSGGITLTADLLNTFTSNLVNVSNPVLTLVNIVSTTISSATNSASNHYCINAAQQGNLTITASSIVGSVSGSGVRQGAILNTNAGSTVINCPTITGGNSASRVGINNEGTLTVNGNVIGGSLGAGLFNAATIGACNVTTATGGSGGSGLLNNSTGTIRLTRAVGNAYGPGNTAGLAAAVGAANAGLGVIEIQELEYGLYGMSPVSGTGIRLKKANTNVAVFNFCDTAGAKTLIDATQGQMPAATDVRSGVSYASGALSGSCAVPAASSVAFGVPVDATTGTAALTPAAVWEYASRTITGGTVTTLTNAPNVPTPSAIADEVWNRQASAITTTNSIGERVKNTATTAIVGNLLAQANS